MSFGFGVAAALAAPAVMTIGMVVWEDHWKGSAFALNLFKCCTATVGFCILSVSTGRDENNEIFPSDVFTTEAIGYLILSSTLGILIGDWMWLKGLLALGARRVILIDALKPFLAAFFGWAILDEELRLAAIGGIGLTVAGVLLVSLETTSAADETEEAKEEKKDEAVEEEVARSAMETRETTIQESGGMPNSEGIKEEGVSQEPVEDAIIESLTEEEAPSDQPAVTTVVIPQKQRTNREMRLGYVFSVLNVGFDTYGAVLIKQYGEGMTVWDINLVRFGFSGFVMLVVSVVLNLRDWWTVQQQSRKEESSTGTTLAIINDEKVLKMPWYALPIGRMSRSSWAHVSVGVLLVTFFAPSLTNYALFQIALALALTLGSVGPIYALPVTYLLQKEVPTWRAVAGAALAVAGIVVLAFRGTLPQEVVDV
jgi:drug/metabolite transporter (DMT)-like permease